MHLSGSTVQEHQTEQQSPVGADELCSSGLGIGSNKTQGADALWNNKSSNALSFDSGNGNEVGFKRSVSPFFFGV